METILIFQTISAILFFGLLKISIIQYRNMAQVANNIEFATDLNINDLRSGKLYTMFINTLDASVQMVFILLPFNLMLVIMLGWLVMHPSILYTDIIYILSMVAIGVGYYLWLEKTYQLMGNQIDFRYLLYKNHITNIKQSINHIELNIVSIRAILSENSTTEKVMQLEKCLNERNLKRDNLVEYEIAIAKWKSINDASISKSYSSDY